eukprot:jgi/Picsp_1/699/NSC_00693-R1_---NA---
MPKRRRNPQSHLAISPWMSKADFESRPVTINQEELEHNIHYDVEDNIIKDRLDESKRSEPQGEGSAWPSVVDFKALVQRVSQQYPLREPSLTLDDGATIRAPNHTVSPKSDGKRNSCFSGNCVIAIDTKGGMHGKLSQIVCDGRKQTERSRFFSGSLIKTYRDCMRDEEWTLALLSFQNAGKSGESLDLLAECSGGDAFYLCSPIELNVEELSYLSNQPILDSLLWNKTIFTFTCHCLKDAQCYSCSQQDMELEKQVDSDVQSILHHFGLEADKIDCINSGVFKLHLV